MPAESTDGRSSKPELLNNWQPGDENPTFATHVGARLTAAGKLWWYWVISQVVEGCFSVILLSITGGSLMPRLGNGMLGLQSPISRMMTW